MLSCPASCAPPSLLPHTLFVCACCAAPLLVHRPPCCRPPCCRPPFSCVCLPQGYCQSTSGLRRRAACLNKHATAARVPAHSCCQGTSKLRGSMMLLGITCMHAYISTHASAPLAPAEHLPQHEWHSSSANPLLTRH